MLFYHHTNVNLPYDRTSHISWWNRFRHPVSCVCFMLQVLRKPKKNLLMCTTDCLHRLSEGGKKKKTGKESWQLTLPRDLAVSRITFRSFPVNRLCFHLKNKNTKKQHKTLPRKLLHCYFFSITVNTEEYLHWLLSSDPKQAIPWDTSRQKVEGMACQ